MMTFTRRTFLLLASVAILPGPARAADLADRIWTGGRILTMNDAAVRAEAVAEKDGKIIAVGSKADVMKLRGDKTKSLT